MGFVKYEPYESNKIYVRQPKICNHPEHNPPQHIVLKPGIYT